MKRSPCISLVLLSTLSLTACDSDVPGTRFLLTRCPGLGAGSSLHTTRHCRPSTASGKKVITGVASVKPHHLHHVARLASEGVLRPVIDRVYRFEDAADAHSYVDTGRKRGSVVLALATG